MAVPLPSFPFPFASFCGICPLGGDLSLYSPYLSFDLSYFTYLLTRTYFSYLLHVFLEIELELELELLAIV